jgi:hypothetical protein
MSSPRVLDFHQLKLSHRQEGSTNEVWLVKEYESNKKTKSGYLKSPKSTCKKPVLRVINEGIAAVLVAELQNKSIANIALCSPQDNIFVRKDGELTFLLSNELEGFDSFHDTEISRALREGLELGGLGFLLATGFFLQDVDRCWNIGFCQDRKKLASIDYGLARYQYLIEQQALIPGDTKGDLGEFDRLPSEDIFVINRENIISGIFGPNSDYAMFLLHHGCDDFFEVMARLTEKNSAIVHQFFAEIYLTFENIVKVVTAEDFSKNMESILGRAELNDEEKIIFDNGLQFWVTRANELKVVLIDLKKSPISRQEFDDSCLDIFLEKKLTDSLYKALAVVGLVKREDTTNFINDMLQHIALEEDRKRKRKDSISPANGGLYNPGVLSPIVLPKMSRDPELSISVKPQPKRQVKFNFASPQNKSMLLAGVAEVQEDLSPNPFVLK